MKPDVHSITLRGIADEVYPVTTGISLKDLFRRHGFTSSEPHTLRRLLYRWHADGTSVSRILSQNTFLMKIVGTVIVQMPIGFIEKDVTVQEKPDTTSRAAEFGAALLTSDYDIAALCEVWTDEVKSLLLLPILSKIHGISEGPPGGTSTVVVAIGSIAPKIELTGSGLCCVSITKPILQSLYHVFSVRGQLPADADALSHKAVLLTRINAGIGTIDLYSTHLYNGGGLAGDGPLPSERIKIQMTQVWDWRSI